MTPGNDRHGSEHKRVVLDSTFEPVVSFQGRFSGPNHFLTPNGGFPHSARYHSGCGGGCDT